MADMYIRNSPYDTEISRSCNGFMIERNIAGDVITLPEDDMTAADRVKAIGGAQSVFFLKDGGSDTARAAALDNPENYLILCINDIDELNGKLSVRHSAALVNPPAHRKVLSLLSEIYADMGSTTYQKERSYTVSGRSQCFFVPYDRILFFEARRKKIIIRTDIQMFECPDTLDNISAIAPKNFMRIHRGFVANISHIMSVNYTDMTVQMDDGSVIYTSRTYRSELRQRIKEKQE